MAVLFGAEISKEAGQNRQFKPASAVGALPDGH